jgi:hypothetical protein
MVISETADLSFIIAAFILPKEALLNATEIILSTYL